MAHDRSALPQRTGRLFLTDGSSDTTLIFHAGLALPDCAVCHRLRSPTGAAALDTSLRTEAAIAQRFGIGLISTAQHFVPMLRGPHNVQVNRKDGGGAMTIVTHAPPSTQNLLKLPPKGGGFSPPNWRQ